MTRSLVLATIASCAAACSPMVYTHGVPNLAEVDPGIYRSGQISDAGGWAEIVSLAHGRHVHIIKLNYDNEGSDALALNLGFEVVYAPIQPQGDQDAWNDAIGTVERPDEARVELAEAVLAQCYAHPDTDFCLVHCTHGQDRTGYVVGKHRVLHETWTKDRAFREMLDHHFHWELVGLMVAWEAFR